MTDAFPSATLGMTGAILVHLLCLAQIIADAECQIIGDICVCGHEWFFQYVYERMSIVEVDEKRLGYCIGKA